MSVDSSADLAQIPAADPAGLRVDLAYSGNVSRRMKRANRVGAAASVLVGEDELARGVATVRNMDTGTQDEVALTSLEEYLAQYR